jgi:hypothetical protein
MTSILDPSTKNRLVKLLGMLGSAHDGEALTAGRLADRLVRQANLTWDDIISAKHEMERRFPGVRAHQYERSINAALRDGASPTSRRASSAKLQAVQKLNLPWAEYTGTSRSPRRGGQQHDHQFRAEEIQK